MAGGLFFLFGATVGAILGVLIGYYWHSKGRVQDDKLVQELRERAELQFENLANRIFESKAKTLSETAKSLNENAEKNLEGILKPLREHLQKFEKSVDEKYTTEAKERYVLKSEIEKLISLNDKMAVETKSLTDALRGDNKVAGDWGEMVLKRVLEASGLREGHEYFEQQSHANDDGDRMRPDVVIQLPDNKHVIVDSKVSLRAFDAYRASNDDGDKQKWLNEHLKSIERHVTELSDKNYAKLKGIKSPDIVLMFIPIEPAYVLAMHADSDLSLRAWQKGVAIVTATTLLTSLKTIASIWRVDKQNRNAIEIAQEGAKLYDKFVGFLEEFEKIGHTFETGQKQYASAMNKLHDGPGNVFRKMERLRELGASPSKSLPADRLE